MPGSTRIALAFAATYFQKDTLYMGRASCLAFALCAMLITPGPRPPVSVSVLPSPFPSFSVSPLSLLRRLQLRRSGRLRCRLRLRLRRGVRREGGLQCGKIAQRDRERLGVVVDRHDVDALLFAAPSRRLACLNPPRPSSIVHRPSSFLASHRRPADQIIATIAVFV